MAIYTTSNPVTADEFVRIIPDGQKADLLDGVIYMSSPDMPFAAELEKFLIALLHGYVTHHRLGRIYGPRSAFRLSATYCPEPDIAFVTVDRLDGWKGAIFQGPPDVAVEIVSDDSIDRDYGTKRKAYEKAGVREYWMLDSLGGNHAFLRRHGGRFREATLDAGRVFRSKAIPGFWLDTRWLTGEPLPSSYEILKRLIEPQ